MKIATTRTEITKLSCVKSLLHRLARLHACDLPIGSVEQIQSLLTHSNTITKLSSVKSLLHRLARLHDDDLAWANKVAILDELCRYDGVESVESAGWIAVELDGQVIAHVTRPRYTAWSLDLTPLWQGDDVEVGKDVVSSHCEIAWLVDDYDDSTVSHNDCIGVLLDD